MGLSSVQPPLFWGGADMPILDMPPVDIGAMFDIGDIIGWLIGGIIARWFDKGARPPGIDDEDVIIGCENPDIGWTK